MKKLGFLTSLLLHAAFFLLVVMISPTRVERERGPRIISVIPVPAAAVRLPMRQLQAGGEPRLQVPVYVRPFFIPGDGRPVSRRGSAGKPQRIRKENRKTVPPAPVPILDNVGVNPTVPDRREPQPSISGSAVAPAVDAGRLKLSLAELDRRSRSLDTREILPPSGFSQGAALTAVPFDTVDAADIPFGPGGSGAAAFGGSAYFDAKGYDITPWARRLVYSIKRNWLYPPAVSFGIQGTVEIAMLVNRSGQIARMEIARSSSVQPFIRSAVNALELSVPLPPLPEDFPNPSISVYLVFRFN